MPSYPSGATAYKNKNTGFFKMQDFSRDAMVLVKPPIKPQKRNVLAVLTVDSHRT
jgi:hypothetical protein